MVTIYPATKPKRIDIACRIFGGKDPIHGIYELKGDQLTINWMALGDMQELPAPSNFNPSPQTTLVTLKRIGKSAEKDAGTIKPSAAIPSVNPAAELKALQGQWKMVRQENGEAADASWLGYFNAGKSAGYYSIKNISTWSISR